MTTGFCAVIVCHIFLVLLRGLWGTLCRILAWSLRTWEESEGADSMSAPSDFTWCFKMVEVAKSNLPRFCAYQWVLEIESFDLASLSPW